MDLVKIGKFIAELRKEKNLTQEELGEKLGVTNKTISRWETGTYMVPADILLAMSQLFDVSVNEILSGKRLSIQEYKQKADENIIAALKRDDFTLKERIEYYKKKWKKDHKLLTIFLIITWIMIMVFGIIKKNIVLCGLTPMLAVIFYGYWNNSMMSYVEKNAFDGKGNN